MENEIPQIEYYEPNLIKETAKRIYKHYHKYSRQTKSILEDSLFQLPTKWRDVFITEGMEIHKDDMPSGELPF